MNEEAGFQSAIVAERDDDTHRLVFADWLDDHGESDRAAFLRAQIQLTRTEPWDPEYADLKACERRLLARNRDSWVEPIRPFLHRAFQYPGDLDTIGVFRRGLLDTAFVDADRFLADPDGLFDAAPVSGLVFWADNLQPELLDGPALGRATRLKFLNWLTRSTQLPKPVKLTPRDCARLAGAGRQVAAVRELALCTQTIPATALATLIRSPHWAGLESLALPESLDKAGSQALGASLSLPQLRHLDIRGSDPGPLQAWRKATWPRQLESLDLSKCKLDIAEVAAFFDRGEWPALATLSLAGMQGDASAGELAKALRRMPRLRSLTLAEWNFKEPLGAVFQSERYPSLLRLDAGCGFTRSMGLFPTEAFPELRDLDIRHNDLAGELAGLADSSLARTLRRLNLMHCAIPEDELLEFARTAQLPELHTLTLGGIDNLGPKGLAALEFGAGYPRLRTLHLHMTGVKLYAALAAAPALGQVKYLVLEYTTLTRPLIDKLITLPGFQGLAGLGFAGTYINAANRVRLRDHFGDRFLE